MGTILAIIAGTFAAGIVCGLIASPSTERVSSAYSQGFAEGLAFKDTHP